MFCPHCRDEYRDGFTWCRDCEVALVPALPDGPSASAEGDKVDVGAGASMTAQEEGDGFTWRRDCEVAPLPALSDGPSASAEGDKVDEGAGASVTAQEEADSLRILELGLVLLVGFGYALVSSLYDLWRGVAQDALTTRMDPTLSGLTKIIQGAPAICVLVYVLSQQRRTLRQLGLTFRWSDLGLGLALAALILPSKTAFWHVPALSTGVLGPISLAGILCLAAKEELIVRAYMMSEALDLTGSAFLAVASSTCFQGLYHLYQGRAPALSAAVTFLIYSIFYWKTRRATPIILAHFAHNLWLQLLRTG